MNTTEIVAWAVKNIVPVIFLVIGIGILSRAQGGKTSQNFVTLGNLIMGAAVIAGAGLLYAFAGDIARMALG